MQVLHLENSHVKFVIKEGIFCENVSDLELRKICILMSLFILIQKVEKFVFKVEKKNSFNSIFGKLTDKDLKIAIEAIREHH